MNPHKRAVPSIQTRNATLEQISDDFSAESADGPESPGGGKPKRA